MKKDQKKKKKGKKLIISGILLTILAWPIVNLIFPPDTILFEFTYILTLTIAVIGLSLLSAGIINIKFIDKPKLNLSILLTIYSFIVLSSLWGIIEPILYYSQPLSYILYQIKFYWIWYLLSLLILIKAIHFLIKRMKVKKKGAKKK